RGPAGFVRGDGPVGRIVLQQDPSFDDLLAALILEEQLAGRPVPENTPFAHYAAALAEGLRPSDRVPLEQSVEGVFAKLRVEAGDPLPDPQRAATFLDGWSRLAAVLRPAMAQGIDPHRQPLFAGRTEFQRDLQYLGKDHETYRDDRRRGQRWLVRL